VREKRSSELEAELVRQAEERDTTERAARAAEFRAAEAKRVADAAERRLAERERSIRVAENKASQVAAELQNRIDSLTTELTGARQVARVALQALAGSETNIVYREPPPGWRHTIRRFGAGRQTASSLGSLLLRWVRHPARRASVL
jgi:hypothetical protein